jgi:hypothetical protein
LPFDFVIPRGGVPVISQESVFRQHAFSSSAITAKQRPSLGGPACKRQVLAAKPICLQAGLLTFHHFGAQPGAVFFRVSAWLLMELAVRSPPRAERQIPKWNSAAN